MAIDVDWVTGVISIPKADLTLIQASPFETRGLDLPQFHHDLRTIHAEAQGVPYPRTHTHVLEYTVSGLTVPEAVIILPPYTVSFEAGAYGAVGLNANSNILDRLVATGVSFLGNNTTGPLTKTDNALRYGGEVHIDVANGTAGTAFPIGTEDNPSSNVADALTIAAANSLRRFHVRGSITLTAALPDWTIIGNGEEAEVNINGQDVADTEFESIRLTGAIGTGPVRARDCEINGLDGISGTFFTCTLLAGNHTLAGNTRFIGSSSGVAGTGTPSLDFDDVAGISLEMRGHAGGVEIRKMTDAGNTISIDLVSGHIITAATCTAMASGRYGGAGYHTNSSGLTFNEDGLVNPGTVWRGIQIPPAT